jgi:hypothetical protein
MAEGKSPARGANFVAKIVKDPKSPPDTVLLTGYLGASSEDDHTRLYFDPGLGSYVEIPDDAILHSEPVEGDRLGARRAWIKRDAVLIYGPAGSQRPKGTFLEGPIMQDHLGAAAGAGGPGQRPNTFWPCTANCPILRTSDCQMIPDRQVAPGGNPHSDFVACNTWICHPSPLCVPSQFVPCGPLPTTFGCFTVAAGGPCELQSARCPPTPHCPPVSNPVGCITIGGCQLQSAACQPAGGQAGPALEAMARGPMVAAPPHTIAPVCPPITLHCPPTPHLPCPTPLQHCPTGPTVCCPTPAPPCHPTPLPECHPTLPPQCHPTLPPPCHVLTSPPQCPPTSPPLQCPQTVKPPCHPSLPPQCHPTVSPPCPTPLQHCPTGPSVCCPTPLPECHPTVPPQCHPTLVPPCPGTIGPPCQPSFAPPCPLTLPPPCHVLTSPPQCPPTSPPLLCPQTVQPPCHPSLPPQCHPTLPPPCPATVPPPCPPTPHFPCPTPACQQSALCPTHPPCALTNVQFAC